MEINKWCDKETQFAQVGRHLWSVAKLFELAKSLPVMEVSLDHINIWHKYKDLTLRDMVMHIKAVQDADLNFPIILDEDGVLMDGRHRIMKCLLNNIKTIKVVRFNKNPDPCRIEGN